MLFQLWSVIKSNGKCYPNHHARPPLQAVWGAGLFVAMSLLLRQCSWSIDWMNKWPYLAFFTFQTALAPENLFSTLSPSRLRRCFSVPLAPASISSCSAGDFICGLAELKLYQALWSFLSPLCAPGVFYFPTHKPKHSGVWPTTQLKLFPVVNVSHWLESPATFP